MVREIENKKQLVINQSEEYCLTKGSWSFTWPVSQKKTIFLWCILSMTLLIV